MEEETKPQSPLLSEDGISTFSDVPPIHPSLSQFPIHLQTSDLLQTNFKMSVSNSLFYAVLKGRLQKIRFLLERGVDVNSRNDYGYNVLVAALHIDNDARRQKMLDLLIQNGANPHKRDTNHGRSVLSWACYLGRENEAVQFLQDYGGDLDLAERDFDGLTALHHATHAGSVQIVKCFIDTLLKYRLSVDVHDSQGMTPYIHARRLGFREIAEMLRQHGYASPSVSDSVFFKSPREWSQIGKFERQKWEQQKRKDERNQAKIEGRITKLRYNLKYPESNLLRNGIPENGVPREKVFVKRGVKKPLDETDTVQRDTVSLPGNTTSPQSTPEKIRVRPTSDVAYNDLDRRGSKGVALSLIGMSGVQRGRIAHTFHHSQLDETKVSEYSNLLGGINKLMDILADEQSPSFRKTVIEAPPPRPKTPKKVKSNVSTLAILFGKDKRKGGRSRKTKTGCKVDEKKKKQSSAVKKNKKLMLPDIRVNDRTA